MRCTHEGLIVVYKFAFWVESLRKRLVGNVAVWFSFPLFEEIMNLLVRRPNCRQSVKASVRSKDVLPPLLMTISYCWTILRAASTISSCFGVSLVELDRDGRTSSSEITSIFLSVIPRSNSFFACARMWVSRTAERKGTTYHKVAVGVCAAP